MSKLTKAELMEGIFNTFKEKMISLTRADILLKMQSLAQLKNWTSISNWNVPQWSQVISSGMPLQRQRL